MKNIVPCVLLLSSIPALLVSQSGTQRSATPTQPDRTTMQRSVWPATITIPKDALIKLVAVESVSSATAHKGDSVRFAVAKDVVIDGITAVSAGTPVVGRVLKVKRGIPNHRSGFLEVQIRELKIGPDANVVLASSDPQYRLTGSHAFREHLNDALGNVGGAVFCAGLLPLCIALGLSEGGGNGKPNGQNAVLPVCYPINMWVVTASTFRSDSVTPMLGDYRDDTQTIPQSCAENFKIDWAVSDYQMLQVE